MTVMCCCPCPSKVEALFEYVSIFVLDVSPHALRTEESACTFFQSIVSDSDPQEEQNFFRHACVIHIYELFFNLKSDFDALQLRVIIFKDLIWPHRNTGLVGLKLTHLHDLHLGHFESKRCKNIVYIRHTLCPLLTRF